MSYGGSTRTRSYFLPAAASVVSAATASRRSTVACSFSLSRFRSIARTASPSDSTKTARAAPRESASRPIAPEPAYRSRTLAPSTGPTMLKTFSRTRSEVGRVSRPAGALMVWPLREPAMIRTKRSLGGREAGVVRRRRHAHLLGDAPFGIEDAQRSLVERRREHAAGGELHVVGAGRDPRRREQPCGRFVVHAQRPGCAARHIGAVAEEGHVLRRAVRCEQAPVR